MGRRQTSEVQVRTSQPRAFPGGDCPDGRELAGKPRRRGPNLDSFLALSSVIHCVSTRPFGECRLSVGAGILAGEEERKGIEHLGRPDF